MTDSERSGLGVMRMPALAMPGAIYMTGEDRLRLRVFNSAASVEVAVEGRFIDCDGRVVAFADTFTPTTDRVEGTKIIHLGEGWLANVMIRASAGTPRRGQTYAILEIVRGQTGAFVALGCLLAGFATGMGRLAWPGSPIVDSTEGAGVIRSIAGTDPAAGVEISETVPANTRWRLIAMSFTLTTDATVANRLPNVIIDDGATELLRIASGTNHTAGLAIEYALMAGGYAGGVGTSRLSLPLPPDLILMAGYRIRTETTAIVAGDNYGAPQLLIEEWIED